MGLEAKVEEEFLKGLPEWLLPLKLNLMGNTGWPDRLILFVWPFIAFIEFKAPGRPLKGERNQPERIEELLKRGYPVLVTDNADEARAFLEAVAVSSTGHTIDDLSGMRGVTPPAWIRKDDDLLRFLQATAGSGVHPVDAGSGPDQRDVQRVAPPEE